MPAFDSLLGIKVSRTHVFTIGYIDPVGLKTNLVQGLDVSRGAAGKGYKYWNGAREINLSMQPDASKRGGGNLDSYKSMVEESIA